jgi:hypothetical protein
VVAVIDIGERPPYRPKLLIRRNGTTKLMQLPLSLLRTYGTCNVIGLAAEWPSLSIIGQPRNEDGSCSADITAAVVWWSFDGGQTWWIA